MTETHTAGKKECSDTNRQVDRQTDREGESGWGQTASSFR